ncbi:hypothetical protein JTE90_003780 [Oedothorax gibbosus]|uniref:PEHE domain-containing protein n=1 Tax=Oedothorax gibbosus TaxID=931172 RepID=A0AAV6VCA6_9ARAC|nr:hypothetical protein JTE90_003780 [Oedothorax gibbosus]
MAPALTKADRRANCLPVVISDPFCVSKTDASDNRKDKINQIAKLSLRCPPLPNNKRKPPHKIWVRTSGAEIPTTKNRISAIDLRTDFVNGKLGLHVEPKTKPCHGTNVRTVAAAAKVRLKYTMNKNNSSFKNMGLAKANTSLGLHSMKRMDRISQFSPNDKGNSSDLETGTGDISRVVADPTSSDLKATFSIVRIVQPALEQSIEEVSSSSRNSIASSKHDTFVSLSDSETLPVLANDSITGLVADNCGIQLSPDINSTLSSRDFVLPISLPGTESPLAASKIEAANNTHPCDLHSYSQSPLAASSCCDTIPINKTNNENCLLEEIDSLLPAVGDASMLTKVNDENSLLDVIEALLPAASDTSMLDKVNSDNCSSNEVQDKTVLYTASAASTSKSTTSEDLTSHSTSLPNCTTEETPFEYEDMSPLSPSSPPLSPGCPSDIEAAASPCSTFSSSSTLSADEHPLLSSSEDNGDSVYFQFPDTNDHVEVTALGFAQIPCTTVRSWFNNTPIPCGPDVGSRCCTIPKQDESSLASMLREQEKVLQVALRESEVLLRQHTIRHVRKDMRTLVSHYQKKFDVPCQRPSRRALKDTTLDNRTPEGVSRGGFQTPRRVSRDTVDVQAEALQGEEARTLCTNDLVNLIRRLEPPKVAVQIPQDGDLSSPEPELEVAADDSEEARNKGKALLATMKGLLRSADPNMTDSSDEASSDVDDALEDSVQKRALWNFMKKRAALASRSTWLIARIHELENQLNTVTGHLKVVSASTGEVLFEDSENTDLSTAGTGGTSLPSAPKPNRPKGLGRPVNGYLNHKLSKSSTSLLERRLSNVSSENPEPQCSRTRPLNTSAFQKRKILATTGMHLTNPKLAKLSMVNCDCNCKDDVPPCILCMGRYSCVQSIDPDSLPLLDRVSLLDPNFHPLLSYEKDVPLLVHYENILKKNEAQYQTVRPPSPVINSHQSLRFGRFGDARSRSRKINKYARTLLSAKYRNKKHFRKHKLVFGKWRKFQNKSHFHARDRIRRLSIASSNSSHDSPVPSPGSAYDDGFGYDLRRRRDDNQFDIDDVIIPYSNKKSRLVKFEFKDIEIPSWRSKAFGNLPAIDIEEDTSDAAFIKRHEGYEIAERKIIRNGGGAKCFFNTWQKRSSRMHRSDSRADSSGANTPDPVLLYDQDIVFQDTSSQLISNPPSPALSPPATPLSNLVSDDSQPALRGERRRSGGAKRSTEEVLRSTMDYDEVAPYSPRVFPLPDIDVEKMLGEADHRYDTDVTASGASCPASPDLSTSSASSFEDDDDITDPEWRVVSRESGSGEPILLKFTKR